MSVPEINPKEPARAKPYGCMSMILALVGILMLLPGLCVLVTAAMTLPYLLGSMWQGDSLANAQWPYLLTWAVFWAVCLLISYGGLKLLKRAAGKVGLGCRAET